MLPFAPVSSTAVTGATLAINTPGKYCCVFWFKPAFLDGNPVISLNPQPSPKKMCEAGGTDNLTGTEHIQRLFFYYRFFIVAF